MHCAAACSLAARLPAATAVPLAPVPLAPWPRLGTAAGGGPLPPQPASSTLTAASAASAASAAAALVRSTRPAMVAWTLMVILLAAVHVGRVACPREFYAAGDDTSATPRLAPGGPPLTRAALAPRWRGWASRAAAPRVMSLSC